MKKLAETVFFQRLVPNSAAGLGMVRAGVHGVFLYSVLTSSFVAVGHLPVTILRPPGVLSFLSWKFFDRLFTPSGMMALKGALVISLLMSTLGYLTGASTKTSAVLLILYQGILRSFGHLNADEMIGLYFLIILALTPCGEGFSLDSLYRTKQRGSWVYAYPILLMQVLMGWCYLTAGLAKLRYSGLAYFNRDNLPIQAIDHSLGNLHDTQFRLAFYLPQFRDIMGIAMVVTIMWEILFPLAVFSRRARPWLLGFGIVFHVATLLTINIFFSNMLAMYLVFVDWPAVVHRLSRTRLLRGVSAWWADFRRSPEEFPNVRVSEAIAGESLLWDGDCMFCASMVTLLRHWARRPFRDRTFQDVAEYLPYEVRQWSKFQMLWIRSDQTVVGGSRALVEVLDAMGYPLLAAVLESPPCRPFTWLGYRLVARNRGSLSAKVGPRCAVNG